MGEARCFSVANGGAARGSAHAQFARVAGNCMSGSHVWQKREKHAAPLAMLSVYDPSGGCSSPQL